MSMSRKLGLIIGAVLFLGGVIFAFAYEPDHTPEPRDPPIRPAKTIVVESAGQTVKRTYTGSVEAQDQVDMAFRVSGPLVQLPVKAGTKVKAGDLLAQIDPRDFNTRVAKIKGSLEQATAQLTAMKAGARAEDIRILESKVAAAQATFENAVVEMKRYKELWERGTESKSRYDSRRTRRDVAYEELQTTKEDLEKGKAGARKEDLDAQEAQIRGLDAQLSEARAALGDTTLKAPFDGVVAKRYVENFEDVRAKQAIVSVQNITTVKIVADLPESLVAVLKKEHVERLTVAFDFDKAMEFDVKVDELEQEADRRTRTYRVTVSMPSPEGKNIRPGMSASLRLYLNASFEAKGGGLAIPADAVFVDPEGQAYVWIVSEAMTVTPHRVTAGDMTGDSIFVQSGLSGGERIVTAGVHQLRDGWTITLLDSAK